MVIRKRAREAGRDRYYAHGFPRSDLRRGCYDGDRANLDEAVDVLHLSPYDAA
jgi:hypothetical protein